jgi:lysophospholipase L1-like esterase
VAVIAGASIVHGRVSANFVDLAARRSPGWQFVNAGFNGDMVAHLLRRLGPVIACEPDAVVILVGTNDVIGTLDTESWRRYRGEKRLTQPPSLDHYRETLRDVVGQLRQWTKARIGLCSLPVLGEDLDSPANQQVCKFNTVIEQVAKEECVSYLPVFERESALLAEHQQRTHTQGRPFKPIYMEYGQVMFLAAMRYYLLGASFDAVSRQNGLLLKTDLIHANSREAGIIADEVEAFLKDAFPA